MPGSGRLLGQQNCTADVPQPEPGKECRGCRASPPHTLDLGAAITPLFALLSSGPSCWAMGRVGGFLSNILSVLPSARSIPQLLSSRKGDMGTG